MSEFIIPVAKADLLKRSVSNAYVVNDVISVRNLRNYLPRYEVCVRQLGSALESTQTGQSVLNRTEMNTHRNALKMHTYLLCQFVDMFENELNANAKSAVGANAVSALDQICRLKLDKLWDPPVAEEDFINLPANCCYKLLEDRDMASNANIRAAVTSLLATLVRRYGHSIACSVKLAQLLQCFPHMVNCLMAIVRSFIEDEKLTGVVRELLKEICSYNGADLERDSQASQNFSNFLLEVARTYPTLAQSILPLLRCRLDEEPYQMRNCVLGIIGEIVPIFAKREQLDPNERVQRDRLMDLLQGLPVSRQSKLAALLVGNLGAMMDVSASARKNACKTLTAMILQCPAAKSIPFVYYSNCKLSLHSLTVDASHRSVSSVYVMLFMFSMCMRECECTVCKCVYHQKSSVLLLLLPSSYTRTTFDVIDHCSIPAKLGTLDENETATKDDNNDDNNNGINTQKSLAKKKKSKRRNSKESIAASEDSGRKRSFRRRGRRSIDSEDEEQATDDDDEEEEDEEEKSDDEIDIDNSNDANVTLCPTAELDAAAALEAAIHSAAAVAAGSVNNLSTENNCIGIRGGNDLMIESSPLRSTSVAQTQLTADVIRQRACVAYLLETSSFILHIQTAIKDFQSMLSSKTISDVIEAIEFFVIAKQAGVKGLENGIRLLLTLIWSQEETIKKAVIEACQKLYLQPDSEEYFKSDGTLTVEGADIVATNLSNFIRDSEIGDLVSMERIIQQLIASNQFDSTLIDHLWQRFIQSASRTDKDSSDDAKSMLLIIKMIVKSGAKEINRHLDTLIRHGLEPLDSSCPIDLERVKFTCEVLGRMVPSTKSDKSGDKSSLLKPFRLPTNHVLFTRLKTILISTVSQPNQVLWVPMMEQAISIIYDLAEAPDSIMCYLLRSTAEKLMQFKSVLPNPVNSNETTVDNNQIFDKLVQSDDDNTEQENVPPSSQMKSDPDVASLISVNVPAFLLSRFLALIGHITLKQLVFMESAVLTELKRRALIQEDRITTGQPNVDEESGLVGVAADDTEADYIRHICDHELLKSPDLVLNPLLNFVTYVCSHPSRFADETVQRDTR
ncbi:condensin complex subunit 1 [Schistosoma bovis]|uniref:Condensin complex subunit 1 n=1 Tax=Schistosoma bovis TaxID=6184 RepID=A0A430QEL8_SCHBO|nr:condensin complex subunit 1 [Schistosoma bovis]